MTAEPIRKCPKCKKLKVKRLIGTGAGLLFKGSGFYITDYRDQGYKDKAKAESGAGTGDGAAKTETAAAGSSNGDSAKSDKPAANADAKPSAPPKCEAKSPKKKHK
jgi:predicted nucleic acid-binding Zn ribbon protein